MSSTGLVVVDVWGGVNSQDHVARKVRQIDDALDLARRELAAGFLVNLRVGGPGVGFEPDFDLRRLS